MTDSKDDDYKRACNVLPDLLEVLASPLDPDDPFYDEVIEAVLNNIPNLSRDVDYKASRLCGQEFWNALNRGQKILAGRFIAFATAVGHLPLRFSVCIHKVPKLYRLK